MIIPNIWENEKCSKPPTRYPQLGLKPSHEIGIQLDDAGSALRWATARSMLDLQQTNCPVSDYHPHYHPCSKGTWLSRPRPSVCIQTIDCFLPIDKNRGSNSRTIPAQSRAQTAGILELVPPLDHQQTRLPRQITSTLPLKANGVVFHTGFLRRENIYSLALPKTSLDSKEHW